MTLVRNYGHTEMYHVYMLLLMVHLHEVDMLFIYYHLCFLGGTKIIISLIIFLKQPFFAFQSLLWVH